MPRAPLPPFASLNGSSTTISGFTTWGKASLLTRHANQNPLSLPSSLLPFYPKYLFSQVLLFLFPWCLYQFIRVDIKKKKMSHFFTSKVEISSQYWKLKVQDQDFSGWILLRHLSWACRRPPSSCAITWPFLCMYAFLVSFPLLRKTPGRLD